MHWIRASGWGWAPIRVPGGKGGGPGQQGMGRLGMGCFRVSAYHIQVLVGSIK